jgi:outer membrane protein assembly factor BamB
MKKFFPLALLIVLLSLLLAGCTGTGLATSWPGITYTTDRVYLSYNSQVFAINPENGSMVWRYPEKANAKTSFFAPPAVTSDGTIVVGDYTHTVHAINGSTGAQVWSYTTGNRIIASAAVADGVILVPSTDQFLYALNPQGQLLWKFETGSGLWAKPLVVEDVVYLPGMDRKLYALDIKNGSLKWSLDMGAAAIGSPVMDDAGILYQGTLGSEILAVNKVSGNVSWRYKATNAIWANMVLRDSILYFGQVDGNIVALDTTTQKPVWQYKAGGAIVGAPALLEDRLMFASENGVLNILDYQGAVLGSPVISEKLYGSPVPDGKFVLVGITTSKDKILAAVDQSGNQVWPFQPPK